MQSTGKEGIVEPAQVLHAWNRCHGAFYSLRESDLLWNLKEQKFLQYWAESVVGVPALWAEATEKGIALGIAPQGLWLSLYGDLPPGIETAFARGVEDFARARGKKRVALGGEEFHFLPGVPVGEPGGDRLAAACREAGFSVADCADFIGAPRSPASEEYIRLAVQDAQTRGWSLKEVSSEREREDLSAFLVREFDGRWRREWTVWQSRSDVGRAFWNLLRDENGNVLGFSRLAQRGRTQPLESGWNPGALRLPLVPGMPMIHTDSCLGPIGIAANERGRGAGKILLGLSLHELSLQGAKRLCIDWTNAYNYYTPLGFATARHYLSIWKNL